MFCDLHTVKVSFTWNCMKSQIAFGHVKPHQHIISNVSSPGFHAVVQATLVSELNRFEAELDSDIRGLERKLSQKQQQRRGRGEVLTLPSTHHTHSWILYHTPPWNQTLIVYDVLLHICIKFSSYNDMHTLTFTPNFWMVMFLKVLCSPKLHLFDLECCKNSNNVKY